ncbi:cuticle collagen 2 [Bubalus bubalis]|uniref:cuticle collagen 2 n=1 Tax=Bubalus bubalis TaxID=89462 RepID=UPI001D11D36D|nr:cuticle collagen 2 [Bubalus bubalis]
MRTREGHQGPIRQVRDDPPPPVAWGAQKGGQGAGDGPETADGRCIPRPPLPGSGLRGAPDCRASVRCARRRWRPAGTGGGGERPPGAARPVPTSVRPQLRLLPLDGARGFPTASEGARGRAHKAPWAGGERSLPARAREAGPPRPHAGPWAREGRSRRDLGAPASASTSSTLRPLGLGPGVRLHSRERSREAGGGCGARGARVGPEAQTLAPRSPQPAAPGQAGRLSVSPASASRGSKQAGAGLVVVGTVR